MNEHFAYSQYGLVLKSRNTLLGYCKGITTPDFVAESHAFGRGGSIRNLLVHIANTYQHWIDRVALKADVAYTEYGSIHDVNEVIALFGTVDQSMERFLQEQDLRTQPMFAIFTHVITHEFHHKGQVLSRSRQLGYTPVDTDVIT